MSGQSSNCLRVDVFSKYFLPAEAVSDRLPCKGADNPEGELGVVNLTTVVEPCEFLEIQKFPPLSCDSFFVVDVKCAIAGGAYRLLEVMIFFMIHKLQHFM